MTENFFIDVVELPFEQRPLPAAHNVLVIDWFNKITPNTYSYWLRLITMIPREESYRVPKSLEDVAKELGMSRPTLYKNVIHPLWNYGFIDLVEFTEPGKEHLKTQKPVNILVYKAPRNNIANLSRPLEKIRDYHQDYTSTAKRFADIKKIRKEEQTLDTTTVKKTLRAPLSILRRKKDEKSQNVDLMPVKKSLHGNAKHAQTLGTDTVKKILHNIYTNNITSKNTFALNSFDLELNYLGLNLLKTQQQQKDIYIAHESEQINLEILKNAEVPELIAENTIKLLAKRDLLGQATSRAIMLGAIKAMEAMKHSPKDVPHTFIAKYIENEIGSAALPAPIENFEGQGLNEPIHNNFAQTFKEMIES